MNQFNNINNCRNSNNFFGSGRNRNDNCGVEPLVLNIACATERNQGLLNTLWTGEDQQVALVCIQPGCELGEKVLPNTDLFLCVQSGQGLIQIGGCRDNVTCQRTVCANDACLIPEGTWQNLINTGNCPLRAFCIFPSSDCPS